MEKSQWRKIYLEKRDAMPVAERAAKSSCIIEYLTNSLWFQEAEFIFTYLNMGSEVITEHLIRQCFESGKRVALPVAKPKENAMYFAEINDLNHLVETKFGVREPQGNEIQATGNTLLVVPGLVFDKQKNRIGYGAGCYDDYLSSNPELFAIGLCYGLQMADSIPVLPSDQAVDQIITENGIFA